ncbi:OTU domain-containing protein [Wolbachia endosymbiont (group A) of Icerya purchasi]|uniref:hypothetical protein n=1 Tax=Wolbachia endosymbiont (group A) of Icerya purchasi TaxID=2954019 RepID=UPI00223009DE|nr:hypothetical protein [Wolbachia endosymbiont (group A) of Icerya purchasi]
MAQGLNELKPGNRFTAKSLREDCADYAKANKRSDFWVYKAVIKDAGIGGYSVELEGPYGPIQDPKTKINMIDEEKTFNKYLECITNTHTETEAPIWGRPEIEGRMICDKYEVELCIYSIEKYGQKVTVTKITANNDDPKVFIEDENLDQLKIDNSKKTVGVVNYMRHFVPLLSRISEDITKSQPVSNEEILGTDKRVPTSDQSEKEVQQEIINISTSAPVYADKASLSSHQPEQKTRQERINTSTSGINPPVLQDHTDRGIPTSDQSEKEVQQEIINTSTSAPVYTNKGIPASHRQEQKTQQKGVQKKINQ